MPEEDGIPEDRARDIKLVASHEFRQVNPVPLGTHRTLF